MNVNDAELQGSLELLDYQKDNHLLSYEDYSTSLAFVSFLTDKRAPLCKEAFEAAKAELNK